MLKQVMISTAAFALLAGSAMAQSPSMDKPSTDKAPNATTGQAGSSAKFIAQQGADHWVFSKFKGTDVLGSDNEHIGDVNDLVFDKSGKIQGIVVGVGGFLGIGTKNVAIDMSAFQVVPPSTNGSTASKSDDPSNIKLKVSWTKDDLKNAPDFQYYKSPSGTASSGTPTTGMAPRNSAPPPAPR